MNYSLWDLVRYFLKLGCFGFGGPVALVGYMQKDLVEERKWISAEDYKQGLALSQLAPGPLAAQLGIYLGFVHYGILGATLTGLAFVLPSFIMVVLIGFFYKYFGGLSYMQSLFYGIGACVVGIILLSTYKLTEKSIGKFNLQSFKDKWILWLFFLASGVLTFTTEQESVLLFLGLGLIYMLIKNPPQSLQKRINYSFGFFPFLAAQNLSELEKIALFFAKAGAFVFGSGLAIIPFLHSGVVIENNWLSEQQFLDSIAVAMITPGPVVITTSFIGYLVADFPGAIVAAIATFLPCYLLTIIPAPYFKKHGQNPSLKSFVDGITASVVGALMGAVIIIAMRSVVDFPTLIIALATTLSLIYFKKLKEPHLIILAGLIGMGLKSLLQ